jgi:phosphatidylserine decarboxylase
MLSDYLKALWHCILPKRAMTTLAGFLATIKNPVIKNHLIRYFIRKYDVNMREAREENLDNYADFNAFFIRHLKPECRPIADAGIVSPVDGYISEIGHINAGTLIQAKGRSYSVHELLACEAGLSSQFDQGLFATLYLSPQDYHRVHMPIEATLKEMIYIPGKLFSVQPATARVIPKLFARNERLVVFFDTSVGLMAMVLVGATIVGAIGTQWHGDVVRSNKPSHFDYSEDSTMGAFLQQAAEMGYFKLGSTVILLFADNQRVQWQQGLFAGDKIRFGQALGNIINEPSNH